MPKTKQPDDKVDDTVKPGEVDAETGKYTDDGLDALVETLKADDKKPADTDDDESGDKKAAKKADETDDSDKREKFIPRSRFDEVVNENQRLKAAQTTRSTAKTDVPPTVAELRNTLKETRGKWQQAIFDNDASVAQGYLADIDILEERIDDTRDADNTNAARVLSSDDIKYDNLLASALASHPVIDKTSEDFNQQVVTDMFEMREAYVSRGYSQTDALQQSIKFVLGPLGSTKKVKETGKKRTTEARKNTVDALTRQPADVNDVGGASDAGGKDSTLGIDINRLTMEQFDKLPEEVKVKLRGDVITDEHLDRRSA
jgi:hypothetical protein